MWMPQRKHMESSGEGRLGVSALQPKFTEGSCNGLAARLTHFVIFLVFVEHFFYPARRRLLRWAPLLP
jgi:hypothetical protein